MSVFIALFRGINVGGKNRLPMKELMNVLITIGLTNTKTYIASGNVIFNDDRNNPFVGDTVWEGVIEMAVERHLGFRPRVCVRSLDFFERVINENPFRDRENKGKAQHIFFPLSSITDADVMSLENLKSQSEAFHLGKDVFYLYAPAGIGRSKLVEKIDRALKTPTTARNLNTIETLRDMAKALDKNDLTLVSQQS